MNVRMVEIDENELALRLAAVVMGKRPPPGIDAAAAVDELELAWNACGKFGPFPFRVLALAASEYFQSKFDCAGTLQ